MEGSAAYLIGELMKILTVSASPYLLVRNGRMNAAIIEKLVDERHEVSTAAWHHDELFFLPEEEGAHFFEKDDRKLATIYPVEPHVQGSSALYELMKAVQPDVVISIGDYKETDFIWEIKAMIPNLFKWVAVLSVDCLPINENHKQQIEYADAVMSISDFGDNALRSFLNADITKEYFGPNETFFERQEMPRGLSFMTSAKNAQASNIGAFIKAMAGNPEIDGYLHTNLYDPGDYDTDLLIDRYDASNVQLPNHYVSVKESISDEEFRDIYCSHAFYVETSVKSASALSMLEAMACGCIPLGMAAGRAGELLSEFSDPSRLIVPHETYIGANEEEFSVISIEGLSRRMSEIHQWAQSEPESFKQLSEEARQIASSYRQKIFTQKLNTMVSKIRSAPSTVAVDCF